MTFHTLPLPSSLIARPGSALGKMDLRGHSIKDTGHSPGPTGTVMTQDIHSLPLFMRYCYGLYLSPQNSC